MMNCDLFKKVKFSLKTKGKISCFFGALKYYFYICGTIG